MSKSDDFFIKENEVICVSNEDYELLALYEQLLDSFAPTTYKTIYVIDYYRKAFYMSPIIRCFYAECRLIK